MIEVILSAKKVTNIFEFIKEWGGASVIAERTCLWKNIEIKFFTTVIDYRAHDRSKVVHDIHLDQLHNCFMNSFDRRKTRSYKFQEHMKNIFNENKKIININ